MRFRAYALLTFLLASPAHALVWPDVAEEVAAGLKANNPVTRRAAAERIATVGGARAVKLLEEALRDPDADVRLAAAQAAIRLRVTSATPLVLEWLQERDARLRTAACEVARALPPTEKIAEQNAVTVLGRALSDTESPLVRAAAADALGALRSAEAVPPLLGRLDDASPIVRVQVVRALARHRDTRAVVPLVGKAQDSAVEVRQAVARGLGDVGDARATQALVILSRDAMLEVKLEAIASLGRMRAEGAVSTLAGLATDRTAATRGAALTSLGQIGNGEAVRVLVGALGQAEDATGSLDRTPVRDALVSAGVASIAEVAAALESTSSSTRAASAAWILGALRAKAEVPRIIGALRRGVLPPAAALRALGGTGAAESVPIVLEYLADASPVVRGEAMRAAGALLTPTRPDGRAVEPLFAALRARQLTDGERATLARLLGRTGAARAAPPLVALLGARETSLRLAAIDALGQLGPAGADDALLKLFRDPDAAVRMHAAAALAKTGGDKALGALLGFIDGGDGIDRAAVLTALSGVLSRTSTPAAIERIRASLDLSAGGDRDALLLALGRTPAGTATLRTLLAEGLADDDDRRTIAGVLSAVRDEPRALIFKPLLEAPEPAIRAQAAWSAAAFGTRFLGELTELSKSTDTDVACNATAGLGRVVASHPSPAIVATLCGQLADERPVVRANALVGLAQAKARCDGPRRVRDLLVNDPVVEVRVAAAHALSVHHTQDATGALADCAINDRSARVVRACQERYEPPRGENAVEVFVVPYGSVGPKARTTYVLELSSGALRCGTSDRRGAVFEPSAPDGEVTLRRP